MTIVYILAAILIFGVLIAVHELGHFLAAKLCGVRVNEFSIGMGPADLAARRRRRPSIPSGCCPSAASAPWRGRTRTPATSGPWAVRASGRRWLIFAAGSFMNFLAGFLIILALYSGAHGFLSRQRSSGPRRSLTESRNGRPIQAGDQFYSVNGERVYLYSDESSCC